MWKYNFLSYFYHIFLAVYRSRETNIHGSFVHLYHTTSNMPFAIALYDLYKHSLLHIRKGIFQRNGVVSRYPVFQ